MGYDYNQMLSLISEQWKEIDSKLSVVENIEKK